MEKYLVFEDDKSKKFWSVRTVGNKLIVVFGRIGTAGQTQEKAFPTPAAAEKDAASQAASKLKKGYVETSPPEGTTASTSAASATASVNPDKKTAPKSENGPAPVAEDGQQKPWHTEEFWEYSWYFTEEEAFAHLDKPGDTSVTASTVWTPITVPASAEDEDIEFDEDDDEDDRQEKREEKRYARLSSEELLAEWRDRTAGNQKGKSEEECESYLRSWIQNSIKDKSRYSHSYTKAEPFIRVLRLLYNDEAEFRNVMNGLLARAMEKVIESRYSFDEHDMVRLQWLLDMGVEPKGETECGYLEYFVQEYPKNPDPALMQEILAKYREKIYTERAPVYADAFRQMIQAFVAGTIADGQLPEGFIGFNISQNYISTFTPPHSGDKWHHFDFPEDAVPVTFAVTELEKHLPALLQRMAESGDFNGLAKKGVPVLMVCGNDGQTLFRYVLNEQAAQAEAAVQEAKIAELESKEDFAGSIDLLEQAVVTLLEGAVLPHDLDRARNLLQKALYSLNFDAQEKANDLLCHYDSTYPILQHDRALWCHQNGSFVPAINIMGWAADKGYAPAADRLAEFKAAQKERNQKILKYKSESKGKASKAHGRLGKDNFHSVFSEEDLFLNTNQVIARANREGDIYVRFKIEGEEGYAQTLDYLNNLLEKGYAQLNDGYQISVRFLIKPVFIKMLAGVKGGAEEEIEFPKTSCHAFFARAVQYPALREKVKKYAENALKLFDWYKDLDSEVNTVPGTFAACALAFCDERYVPMIGLFGRNSDDEHQYIQLLVAGPLFKQYGATPEVAAALFDIQSSNGQEGDINLNKALLTTPACLVGVMEHVAAGNLGRWEARHLNYQVPGYVEAIWGDNTKGNLKKLKAFADGAATAEDRNAFVDFYNFYKKYASLNDKKDYGEDIEGVSEKKDVVVPVYHEDPPVLLKTNDAVKAGWLWSDTINDKRGVFFFPVCIDDPFLLDFVYEQWEIGCAGSKEFSETFNWGEGVSCLGNWVFNTEGLAQAWGLVLTDGKNKPYVLYGVLNVAQISARWSKRPFKTPEEVEAARQAAFIREAPERIRLKNEEERAFEVQFDKAFSAVWNEYYWAASQLLQSYTPEHGRYYDAALLLRIKLAKKFEDLDGAAALYDELAARRPEFAGHLAEKKAALGKEKLK
jgi:predicted DNA-binding WGR domain protein